MSSNSIDNLIFVAFKTGLAYFVFIVSFFSLPLFMEYKTGDGFLTYALNGNKKALLAQSMIEIEIADSIKERKDGLSGRKELKPNEGMLFIFDEDDYHGIWMKDMNFSIDILWMNTNLEIIHMKKNVSPETFPEVFGSPQKARYVLELPAGFVDKNNIYIGDQMIIM